MNPLCQSYDNNITQIIFSLSFVYSYFSSTSYDQPSQRAAYNQQYHHLQQKMVCPLHKSHLTSFFFFFFSFFLFVQMTHILRTSTSDFMSISKNGFDPVIFFFYTINIGEDHTLPISTKSLLPYYYILTSSNLIVFVVVLREFNGNLYTDHCF